MDRRLLPGILVQVALLLVGLFASACGSGRADSSRESIEPRFQRAFLGLDRALDGDEDETARRILAVLMAQQPTGSSLKLAEAYARVLDGRALREQLEFALEGELVVPADPESDAASYRVSLICTNHSDAAVRLWLPPPTVERMDHRLYLSGSDSRAIEHRVVDGLDGLALEAGERVRVDLGVFDATLENALARRDLWSVESPSGEVETGGQRLPMRAPEVASYERVFLAPFLSTEAVEPEVLLEYVQRPSFTMPGLLERTIRIDPALWTETLRRLASVVPDMDDERLAYIAPALRWLSRSARFGGDPRSWRLALANLPDERTERGALDLPLPATEPELSKNTSN